MGEGSGQKKDEFSSRFRLTSCPKCGIMFTYTGARDGAHQKKS